jgi:hypothetical protein
MSLLDLYSSHDQQDDQCAGGWLMRGKNFVYAREAVDWLRPIMAGQGQETADEAHW